MDAPQARRPSPEQVELETKIGFLEHTLDELNDVILDQGRAIEALTERIAQLERRSDGGGDDASSSDLADHRPPHY